MDFEVRCLLQSELPSDSDEFKAQLQGYMLNDQNEVIDSLFVPGQNIIKQAITDANNVVLNSTSSQLVADFNKDKIDHLEQCKQIKFVSFLYL